MHCRRPAPPHDYLVPKINISHLSPREILSRWVDEDYHPREGTKAMFVPGLRANESGTIADFRCHHADLDERGVLLN